LEILRELNKSKWHIIVMIFGIVSFIYTKYQSDEFISNFNNKVNITKLCSSAYTLAFLKVVGLMLLTVLCFVIVIYLATSIISPFLKLLQTIIALSLIIWTLLLAWTPFIAMLAILGIISIIISFTASD
jgi:hypothetical protein